MRKTVIAVVVLLAAAAPARAEYVLLRNGQRLHVTGYERAGDVFRLHISGGRVEVRAAEVAAIEPEDVFPALPRATLRVPFADLIREAATLHGLEEELISSVIAAESNFNPRAISPKNAKGLMQIMPRTAAQLGIRDLFDPQQNIHAGTQYLKQLLSRYNNDFVLALAAYNAGPESVDARGGVPPIAETREYLQRVLRFYNQQKVPARN